MQDRPPVTPQKIKFHIANLWQATRLSEVALCSFSEWDTLPAGGCASSATCMIPFFLSSFRLSFFQTGEPRVRYRETISLKTNFDYCYKRQSGGRGQYGKVIGYIEPIPEEEQDPDDPIIFRNDLSGPAIPPNYIKPIEKGFKEALVTGLMSGSPAQYVRVVLTDGNYHEVDSSEYAFKLACFGAIKQAYPDAGPLVLEPIMDVEICAPAEFQAALLSTITNRKGSCASKFANHMECRFQGGVKKDVHLS